MAETVKSYWFKPKKELTAKEMVAFMTWFVGSKHFSAKMFESVPDEFKQFFEEREMEMTNTPFPKKG